MEALILALFMRHSASNAVPETELVPEIVRVSQRYGQDPVQVTQIMLIESRGREHALSRTGDYGLMQINPVHKVSIKCLRNWRCNLRTGVRILSQFDRVCRYNVGTGVLKGDRLRKCLRYERKLASIK